MSAMHSHDHAGHAHDHHDDHGPAKGFKRWLTTTNHKDIGTMYLLFSLLMFFIGGGMALVIRAELFMPGLQLVDPGFFNTMTTVHALIMVFGAVMPATVGLANSFLGLFAFSPVLGGWVVGAWGYGALFLLSAGLAVLGLWAVRRLPEA